MALKLNDVHRYVIGEVVHHVLHDDLNRVVLRRFGSLSAHVLGPHMERGGCEQP
jgi:hypothetical protein